MISWGIIGAGNIAHRFAKSLQYEKEAVLYAISGRNKEKLNAFREEYSCEQLYTDFDALLRDEKVDAVYIALPHNMHKEWAVRALKAHKAVLVEKPAALNADEVTEIISAAKEEHVLFMEAMKERFTPGYRKVKELVQKGVIGEIVSIQAADGFTVPEERFRNSYYSSIDGGGVLLDTGCYGVSWIVDYLKGSPVIKSCDVKMKDGVDIYSDTVLAYGNKTGELIAAFDRDLGWHVTIRGSKGYIEVNEMHRPREFDVFVYGQGKRHYEVPYVVDDFHGEIQEFDRLINEGRTESEIMTYEDSISVAKVMDLIRKRFPIV